MVDQPVMIPDRTSQCGSVSGLTKTIASECESDETLPPDAELEYDIDIMSDGCVSEDIDTQAEIFD
ncbi:hypothetical protein DPMN_131593 [Dreissena polymorpha]|uniref:Uncharacterized protein n=1 Tax=Dreissena polymorpha TaxID=45954 RepID=A0A9D4FQX5_DREPO|nr:hypothetical protein DPMN_131593 [Dreissena polymorpha]